MTREAKQATPREQLLKELMDSRVFKTEREHAAAREIIKLRAAAGQALEALKYIYPETTEYESLVIDEAIAALRAALAEQPAEPQDPVAYNGWVLREVLFDNGEPVGHREPTKAEPQEPVATVTSETGNPEITMSWWHTPALPVGTKLYTAPQPRKRLTDEEIDALEEPIESKQFMYCENQDGGMDVFMVSSEQDLQRLCGWMKTGGDFDCSQDDQEMVDWMQVADIGEVHFHRLGCLVRLKDKK